MERSVARSEFDAAYEGGGAIPWMIGEPQPAIVALEQAGQIGGAVLDPGCGAGEHTIYLTQRGYDVLGVDFSEPAVEIARANAEHKGVPARFEVADALNLGAEPRFDTIVDSALFHVFSAEDRARYVSSLRAVCKPGAVVHVLALSDAEEGFGPRIPASAIRDAFADGWELAEIRPTRYRGIVPEAQAAGLGLAAGTTIEATAWQATARLR